MRRAALVLAFLMAASSVSAASQPHPGSFWFQLTGGTDLQTTCDPFGQQSTECVSSTNPAASLEMGTSWFRLHGVGGKYSGPLSGRYGEAKLEFMGHIAGPISFGFNSQGMVHEWDHQVFSSGDTRLATRHQMRALFVGLQLGVGSHIIVTASPGLWENTYTSAFVTPGFTGEQRLAYDHFALGRVGLNMGKLQIGSRLRLSAHVERIWSLSREIQSSVIPREQWSGGFSVTARIWTPRRGHGIGVIVDSNWVSQPGLVQDHHTSIHLAWRLK